MGLSKTDNYTAEQNELADTAKLLSSPARIAILEHLAQADCCVCKDLTELTQLRQPTVSKHLADLKAAGLVLSSANGTSREYCINPLAWARVRTLLLGLLDRFKLPGCC